MPRARREPIDGASVGLAFYAGFCCAVTAALAFGLYQLMQPTRLANPGAAAYHAAHGSFVSLAARMPYPPEPIAPTIGPVPEATGAAAPQPAGELKPAGEPKKTSPVIRAEKAKPQRPRRREWRDPMQAYAYQPFYGGYGGYGGYRRW